MIIIVFLLTCGLGVGKTRLNMHYPTCPSYPRKPNFRFKIADLGTKLDYPCGVGHVYNIFKIPGTRPTCLTLRPKKTLNYPLLKKTLKFPLSHQSSLRCSPPQYQDDISFSLSVDFSVWFLSFFKCRFLW